MRTGVIGVIALGLLTAACGTTEQQRSATGGLTGLGVGALVGGPVGAAVGVVAGAVGGAMMPEDATSLAENMLGREHRAANNLINGNSGVAANGAATVGSGSSVPPTARGHDFVREAQMKLRDDGYYHGRIDGIAGPQTHRAVRDFQRHEGLQQTARLDRPTADRLGVGNNAASDANYNNATNANPGANGNYGTTVGSGNSAAPGNGSGLNGQDVNPPAGSNTNDDGGAPQNASPAAPGSNSNQ